MKKLFDKVKRLFSSKGFKKVFKILLYFVLGLFALIVISAIGLRIYFEMNKTEIVGKINTQINENINGEAKIGDIGYKFLIGFPNFTVVLKEVELKDSLIAIHKRPVLKAGEIEVRLNVLKLLKKEVNIRKIVIIDAKIDLFVDKNGVSNSNIFKPKKSKTKKSNNTTTINEVYLKNVNFISENQKGNKLFHFDVKSLKCKILYTEQGWKTDVRLNTFAKSLAFNSLKGSFVKDQEISGDLIVNFSQELNKISIVTQGFKIGEDDFKIKANFNVGKGNSLFDIDIRTQIKWGNASKLLANNISSKLNKFALNDPLQASCVIKGDMSVKGDPEIVVNAEIKDDELTTLQGVVKECSFHGKFTNNYKNGLGCNDANSAVIVTDFKGIYKEIPVSIPSAIINNLEKPVATGKLNTNFELPKLGSFIDEDFITFTGGKVKVNFDFKVDIVDVKLHKPKFTGAIIVKKGTLSVKTKNMHFQNTDIELYFTEEALLIKKIKFQNKVNTVFMEGRVDNFLNLYYDDPEKLNLNWKIYSPYLDLKQIVGILTYNHQGKQPAVSKSKKPSYDLREVLRKAQATLEIQVDKLTYKKMIADDFKVKIVLAKKGLFVNNVSIQGSTGSTLNFDAQVIPQGKTVLFKTNIQLTDGNVSRFLASFNNFGVKSFTPNDIKGNLSFKASLIGVLNQDRELLPNTINGNLVFRIKDGALSNFEPIQKIGKIAFPNRDVKNITFSDLAASASIKGNLVDLKDLKVTSNVLNIDAKGTYSLANSGTNLAVKIPLRNPKDDYKIADQKGRDAVRYKGIVVNLLVVDGKDGQTKIKLGKPSDDKSKEEQPKTTKTK
ncbi:AsmA family protein [Flavobacterium nackdongense]|uniref:AsmA family protein n=1 Tax=Flavobacterium nackdongense TaxID=2547394 RepID=A0A4P6YE91_9FLAO|nr:AsmA family protein [Flavobacterium nackdongense]QBN19027.1 AsmA family protein [Flavobacterium nackdongense]